MKNYKANRKIGAGAKKLRVKLMAPFNILITLNKITFKYK